MDFKMINECNTLSKNKIISKEENKRKFIIKNNSNTKVNIVEVDDCLITNGNKCDWLFEILDNNLVFYVELKGKNIDHAFVQLETTINYCKSKHNKLKKNAYIVSSRVPSSGTDIQEAKKYFTQKLQTLLTIKNNKIEVTI